MVLPLIVRATFAHLFHQGSHWLRIGTSVLAMAVAVASVVIMVAIGAGALQTIRDLVALEGTNIIYVVAAPRAVAGVRLAQETNSVLTVDDAVALKASVPEVRESCWWRQDPSRLVHEHENWFARVLSISPGCQSVKGWWTERGREISQFDFDRAQQIAVIGRTVAERLFGDDDPVGSMIRIKHVPFQVVGLLEEKGIAPGGFDQDDVVLIPYTTAKQKLVGSAVPRVDVIAAATFNRGDLPSAAETIKALFRSRHRIEPVLSDDVLVRTQLEVEKIYEETSETLMRLLVIIALISLLVGGIGIMNILLVSITERTREIGVRIAVGAKRRHILLQFLIEAMTLSLAGGCLGIVLGLLGARLTTMLAGWPTVISGGTVAVAVVFSLIVGLFFGLYPANKASRLNPIDALRFE